MNQGRYIALDGLRGIAALAVVFSHIASMTWMPFKDKRDPELFEWALWHLGAPAVDIFLVLSGFVIARSLIKNPSPYLDYMLSRMVRLYPVAWVAVGVGFALRGIGLEPFIGMSPSIDMKEELGISDIIGLMTMIGPIPNVSTVNPPLWTLVLEMQAAFFMPVLAYVARRNPALLAAIGLIVLFSLTMITSYVYPIFFYGFFVGAALAGLEGKIPVTPKPVLLLVVAGIALMMRHYLSFMDFEDYILRIPSAVAAAGVIIAIQQGAGKALLESKPVQWLGDISYPLYAVHWPILAGVTMMYGKSMGVTTAAIMAIPFAILIAWLVGIAVDKPAITLSKILRPRQSSK